MGFSPARRAVLGGALADPVDSAVLLFKGTRRGAEEFAKADPYDEWAGGRWWVEREHRAGSDAATPIRA
jgi:hypothetical protein